MAVRSTEYGARGLLGIGTPQANPTVEQEMRLLCPRDVAMVNVRLFSPTQQSRQRLQDYLINLGDTLRRFDTLHLDAFGFACTASSYLPLEEPEETLIRRLEDQAGCPIITAATAIEQALQHLQAKRILIVAPYPEWLSDLSLQFWKARDFDVVKLARVPLPSSDTRTIYGLTSEAALAVLREQNYSDADVVLLSGTGMPTLNAIRVATAELGVTVLSSNLCLLWALLQLLGIEHTGVGPL